jgi:protein-S-isoprenylcysteine O-methyltransferase Ste14
LLFGVAGRVDLPWFWVLIGVHAVMMFAGGWLMDPDLRKERRRPGGKGLDCGFRPVLSALILAHLVVAALDAGRYGWSPTLPPWLRAAGLAVYVAGFGLSLWAMAANRFFSPVVRLQTERGHEVVRRGPYAYVRHPGYVGVSLAVAGEALVLGSLWSLAPLLPALAVIVWRTTLEDRFLRENLTGYAQYASTVPYRLAPGVW